MRRVIIAALVALLSIVAAILVPSSVSSTEIVTYPQPSYLVESPQPFAVQATITPVAVEQLPTNPNYYHETGEFNVSYNGSQAVQYIRINFTEGIVFRGFGCYTFAMGVKAQKT